MSPTQEKPLTLKSLSHKQALLTGGHRMCSGCGAPTIVRQVLLAVDEQLRGHGALEAERRALCHRVVRIYLTNL